MKIEVTVDEVSLASVVDTTYAGINEDGEEIGIEAVTIRDLVVIELANRVVKDPEWPTLRTRISQIRDDVIRSAIEPAVTEAMAKPIQLTDSYGSPKGEPTTLRELVMKEAQTYLTRAGDGYGGDRVTPTQKFIRDEIGRQFQSELKAVIDGEKAKVKNALRAKAADFLADAALDK